MSNQRVILLNGKSSIRRGVGVRTSTLPVGKCIAKRRSGGNIDGRTEWVKTRTCGGSFSVLIDHNIEVLGLKYSGYISIGIHEDGCLGKGGLSNPRTLPFNKFHICIGSCSNGNDGTIIVTWIQITNTSRTDHIHSQVRLKLKGCCKIIIWIFKIIPVIPI